MTTLLILTVGGSHQPLLTSINQHHPDKVYFLCSDDLGKLKGSYLQVIGEGKVLKSRPNLDNPDLPNIVTLAKLAPEQFHVHKIQQFDDLNACYLDALRLIDLARAEFPGASIQVDYTGGTKSMTAGLVAAALDDGQCDISLVAGHRADLVKVQDQTQFVRPVRVWDAQSMRRLKSAQDLIARYDYAGAEALLRAAAARFASDRTLQILQRGIALCHAFDAWDKFDHATARQLLRPYQGEFVPHWRILGCLTEESRGHGFESVEDLLHNADRRATQGRYDDAVGRIYRALELTAQVWLQQQHKIDTGKVDLAAIPDSLREKVQQAGRVNDKGEEEIKIGLRTAWDVIAAFAEDPLGGRFAACRGQVINFLTKRNASLFAHGFRPVSRDDYDGHVPLIKMFLIECIADGVKALGRHRPVVLAQLPVDFLKMG